MFTTCFSQYTFVHKENVLFVQDTLSIAGNGDHVTQCRLHCDQEERK